MSTRTYELIYILKPEATESRSPTCTTQVEHRPAPGRHASRRPRTWGRRKLAYEIGQHKKASTSST